MNIPRVGVLMGGPSSEHDVSLMSGMNVLRALKGRVEAYPIFITKAGSWLFGDEQRLIMPGDACHKVDVMFNALHGEYGEDGKIQRILEHNQMPFTGSGALASAMAMNKEMSQKVLEGVGIKMPKSLVLARDVAEPRLALAHSAPPWIIKPRSRGSSLGVTKASNREHLPGAFESALETDSHLIIQEFIPGREVTCGVIEGLDGRIISALTPIEIVPPESADFFDYKVKYNGKTTEVCPAPFYGAMLAKIQETALKAHEALGLRHYSRTDMIIKPSSITRRAPELYVLEVNTLPGLTRESLFPKAAQHRGLEFPDLVMHLIRLAK
ncbi:MAG: D-alanine--D-alanine ligase [bacterium]|nr:D-alanine--D-alanine ligase [bacterium]